MPSNTNPVHMKNGDNYSGYNFIMPSDTKDCVTAFTSSDNDATTEKTSDGFTSVATMASGESHASLFQKISKMFLNIRKLWNTVGSTAIPSELGTTVTGAISNLDSRLNGTVLWSGDTDYATSGTLQLSESYKNFVKLKFRLMAAYVVDSKTWYRPIYREILCSDIDASRSIGTQCECGMCWGWADVRDAFDILSTSTDTVLAWGSNSSPNQTKCTEIRGFKYLI